MSTYHRHGKRTLGRAIGILLLLSLVLVFLATTSCESVFGTEDESDTKSEVEDDTADTENPIQVGSAEVAQILSKAVGSITGNVSMPATLTSTSGTSSLGAQAVTSINYDSLPDNGSGGYSFLKFYAQAMDGRIQGVLDELGVLKEQFESVRLAPGDVWSEETENGETLRFTYTTTDVADVTWYQITAARFDEEDQLLGGSYMEVTESADGEVAGQSMHMGVDPENTFYSKLSFDTTETTLEEYSRFDFGSDGDFDESGHVRFTPTSGDADHAVELSLKWQGEEFGAHTQLAWANDQYGGVLMHGDPDPSTDGDEHLREEQFYLEGTGAKIIFRQEGNKSPTYLFEPVYIGREAMNDPEADFWNGNFNAYSADYEPPEDGPSAPETLWVQYDDSTDPPEGFDVFTVDPGSDGATPLVTSDKNPHMHGIYWLVGYGTSILPGDAVYRLRDHNLNEDTMVAVAEYYKVSEIPPTAVLFGDTGFYVQEMVPLKYMTGTFSDGSTIIKVDKDAIDLGDGVTEDRYFVDSNNDDSFGDWSQIDAGEPPDLGLMVMIPEDESYYDETTQQVVSTPGTPWVLGDIPAIPLVEEASLTYSYASASEEIFGRFSETGETNYIESTDAEAFPILGEPWKEISLSDF